MNRRDFMKTTGTLAAVTAFGTASVSRFAFAEEEKTWKTKLYKALISGAPNEKTLKTWKAAGIQGTETTDWSAGEEKAAQARIMAEKLDMKIHSVMRGWTNFNQPENLEKDIESVKLALRSAKAYGADTILLVPCRIGGMKMPEPWEFKIDFDPDTLMISKVAEGDNAPYQKYIEAHNNATKITLETMDKLKATAEELGVVIALENVWNNLWVHPGISAALVRKCDSPWIRFYLDLGNHVRYAPTTEWVKAFREGEIAKMHVKGFKLNPNGQGGNWCNSREASIDWPAVRQAIEDINYSGWLTIEESGTPEWHNGTLDMIIAGKSKP
ncbi:MAG: TIM barrel protein [Planctomycetia bacterium]|nr:TIM barrel protein [Planctomycetia bacterium]